MVPDYCSECKAGGATPSGGGHEVPTCTLSKQSGGMLWVLMDQWQSDTHYVFYTCQDCRPLVAAAHFTHGILTRDRGLLCCDGNPNLLNGGIDLSWMVLAGTTQCHYVSTPWLLSIPRSLADPCAAYVEHPCHIL